MVAIDDDVITATRGWVDRAVLGLTLCPFAKSVPAKNQVHYAVSAATTPEALLIDLVTEMKALVLADPEHRDDTLLIHPHVLADFREFVDFLELANATLNALKLEGVIQLASFHPRYQFAGTRADDISNYTNRSPYPTLHLLRESSIDRAVAAFPDAAAIFDQNIATLRRLGHEGWRRLEVGAPAAPRVNGPARPSPSTPRSRARRR